MLLSAIVLACILAALLAMGQLIALLIQEKRAQASLPPPTRRRLHLLQRSRMDPSTVDDAGVAVVRDKLPRGVRILEGVLLSAVLAATILAALVVIGPRFLPYQVLVVRSGSMSPTIPTGSLVVYHRVNAAQVHKGQVILYNEPGNPAITITHRVVKVVNDPSGRFFITKGDANGSPDPWHVKAVGVGWVVAGHVPYLGYAMVYLESAPARLLLVTLPALALGVIFVLESWRPKRRSEALAN